MKVHRISRAQLDTGFEVIAGTERAQAALMVIVANPASSPLKTLNIYSPPAY